MGYLELAVVAFVVLAWIIGAIYKFITWTVGQVKNVGVAPSPIQQAIAEAQRQQAASIPQPRPQPPTRQTPNLRPLPMPRRSEAGSPAVPREATRMDFDRSERELLTAEPTPLDIPLRTVSAPLTDAAIRLFQDTDDFVRAMILQEVLGPPLSRRSPR